MAKKDFSAALNAGVKRDQELRDKSVVGRFDRVEAALDGRETLLDAADPVHTLKTDSASFYVETLEKEGRVRTAYVSWPIDKIDDNPLNSRTIYQEEKIAARAASMSKDGQLVPALAARHPSIPERVILIDGHYRKQGALRNRWTELELKVLEGLEPIDFYRLARAANNEREQETVLDVALGYKKLLDEGYANSNDELAALVGEGKTKVSKTLAVLDLPPVLHEFISIYPEQFGINISYELALYYKATDEARTREFAQRIVEEGLSFLKVKAAREGLAQQRAPRKTFSRQYKVSNSAGASIGTIKEWGSGNIQVSLALDNPERAEAYIEALRQLLEADGHKAK
ncbi:ParB/RepB/Spo0J family partition protein [Paraburkholderia acidisoli]|uniref:ParB/RepB/Spo0J family partition protein n=1 Tax=Paraburkholderia acidisoli TaxID=2571748 RepID=A0A7Z2GS51_9BURK|nr:ParB/RepB/Spo0J family partition protein [Paraburkholderia acidisoli]QGZ66958.1 ParB/RepB/Spo0J family partition protein [Paraburkholderia acidisoli]